RERRLDLSGVTGGGTLVKNKAEQERPISCSDGQARRRRRNSEIVYTGSPARGKAEGCEAAHRRTDARSSWLGKLLPDGECRPGVQPNGLLRTAAAPPVALSAGRVDGPGAATFYRRSTSRRARPKLRAPTLTNTRRSSLAS